MEPSDSSRYKYMYQFSEYIISPSSFIRSWTAHFSFPSSSLRLPSLSSPGKYQCIFLYLLNTFLAAIQSPGQYPAQTNNAQALESTTTWFNKCSKRGHQRRTTSVPEPARTVQYPPEVSMYNITQFTKRVFCFITSLATIQCRRSCS